MLLRGGRYGQRQAFEQNANDFAVIRLVHNDRRTKSTIDWRSRSITRKRPRLPFPVVGIGASAGGLEAFDTILRRDAGQTGHRVSFSCSTCRRTARAWWLKSSPSIRPCRCCKWQMAWQSNRTTCASIRPGHTLTIKDGALHLGVNEELQSTNEELQTSKEELQSLNEELTTVNAQLEAKMEELEATTQRPEQPAFQHGHRGGVPRYAAADSPLYAGDHDLFELIPSDIGRPMSDMANKFSRSRPGARLPERCWTSWCRSKRKLRSASGRVYVRRMLPYRTSDNRIEGVVITFVDISRRKQAEDALARARSGSGW